LEDHGLLSFSFLRTSSSADQSLSVNPGSDIQYDGKSVGKVLSVDSHSNLGFALLRIEEDSNPGKHDPSKTEYRIEGVTSDSTYHSKALTVIPGRQVHPYIPLWWP